MKFPHYSANISDRKVINCPGSLSRVIATDVSFTVELRGSVIRLSVRSKLGFC